MKHSKSTVATVFATIFLFLSALLLIAMCGLLQCKAAQVAAHFWWLPTLGATLITFSVITDEKEKPSQWGKVFIGAAILFFLVLSLTSCGKAEKEIPVKTKVPQNKVFLYRAKNIETGNLIILQVDYLNSTVIKTGDTLLVSPSKQANGRYELYHSIKAVANGPTNVKVVE